MVLTPSQSVIFVYQLLFGLLLAGLTAAGTIWFVDDSWYQGYHQAFNCIYIGGLASVLYCLRALYLNICARKNWDSAWEIWYYIRPICGLVTGLLAYVFLKAGLLVLDAKAGPASSAGLYALAFIAGYNVDNFLKKLEEVADTVWGIDPSGSGRARQNGNNGQNNDDRNDAADGNTPPNNAAKPDA